ncbi:hypothetical protein GCM10009765_05900 [Fodinicola feengrottensis]|uniref:Methyltransferase type 11 domain-containing protein n=2 Tax=Fodinicola feengrottensis TaxID=435914 RepID=A0ABP4RST1_9ACTN
MLWFNKQDDVLEKLDIRPGEDVLEIGYGPGGLIRLLAGHTQARTIYGVDPSESMHKAAVWLNRKAERVRLAIGTAEKTGLDEACVDCVVSINNVAIWPDLAAGVGEIQRVLRPGGRVAIGWHGGRKTGPIADGLRLPPDKLARIESALTDRFAAVQRESMAELEMFRAV